MKKLTGVIVLLVIVYFFACDDAGIIKGEEGVEFSGTIINWTSGGNIILKAVLQDTNFNNWIELDTTKISASGEFTLYLRAPADSMYKSLNSATIPCPNNLTITPNSRTTTNIIFQLHNDSAQVGTLVRNNFDMPQAGYFNTYYEFINRDINITGTVTCPTDTIVYNFSGTAGLTKFVYIMDDFPVTHSRVVSTEPSGGRWQVLP